MKRGMKVAGMKAAGLGATLLLAMLLGMPVMVNAQVVPATSTEPDQPTDELVPPTSASDFTSAQLDSVLAGSWRSPANRARDVYRHPKATLQFFGIRPDQTVVEITPGGGWYSEILAPLLHDNGHYIAAVQAPAGDGEARRDGDALHRKFAADAAHYGNAKFVEFDPKAPVFGPPGSADLVLTFRNVHNWVMATTAPAMFKAFFAVLQAGRRARRGRPSRQRWGDAGYGEAERLPADPLRDEAGHRGGLHAWTRAARSTPTRRTPRITRRACGRCRPRSRWASRTGEVPGDRRIRPHDAALHQAGGAGSRGIGSLTSSRAPWRGVRVGPSC